MPDRRRAAWLRARSELDGAVARVNGDQVKAELAVGNPARVLKDISESLDLLILGSRGYGPLHAVLVGGVSGRLMREAACPVVVFPPGLEHPERAAFAGAATVGGAGS